ncbi:hypothetical protein [Deinococcus sp. SL84]|uniref:hypothetical protein n=1 Tax=Deinococcus sp. SL84 TaxID=2994663 RepID=UPI002274281F|nr:hypothetical protein [Deinococcus sp. SL84]MCY1702966.1 hypothetical protein [Deinococcus sp. SL84]
MGWPRTFSFSRGAATLLSMGLAALPVAQAQDLGSYRELSRALSTAQSVRPTDVGAALHELDRAEAAFAVLRPSLRDPQLSRSIQGTLDQARAALARTPADLQAQTIYAQALLRQTLYTQTLQDLLQGGAEGADKDTGPQLQKLAHEFGLGSAETAALDRAAQAGEPEAVAARLQLAAARQIVRELQPWRSGAMLALNRDEAYLRLTRASGWHLHLSELDGTPAPAAYTAALQQLAQGDLAGTAEPVRQLYVATTLTARQLQQSLEARAATPSASVQTVDTSAAASTATAAPQAAASIIVVPASPVASEAGAQAQAAQTAQPAQTTPPNQPASVQGTIQTASPVYTALARALAASANRDQAAAHQALTQAAEALNTLPAAWQGPATADLAAHMHVLSQRSWLEPSDVAAEIVRMQALEAQVQGEKAAPPAARIQYLAAHLWNGQVQAVAFLLLTLLLPLPFYFKFRALGHQKGEWALIVTGIGMLVVPAFAEGLIVMGSWLGRALDSTWLQSVGFLSMRYTPLGHFLWWLFTLIGTLLMTAGFYRLSRTRARLASAKERWAQARVQAAASAAKAETLSYSAQPQPQTVQPPHRRSTPPPEEP